MSRIYYNVPIVSPVDPGSRARRMLAQCFADARTSHVNACIFGDSMETNPSGNGAHVVTWINAMAASTFGGTPATMLIPIQGGTSPWCALSSLGGGLAAVSLGFQSSTSTTITASGLASTTDDAYNGWGFAIAQTSGAWHHAIVTDYVGSTKTLTISPAMPGTPTGSFTLAPQPTDQLPPSGIIYGVVHTAGNPSVIQLRPGNENGGGPQSNLSLDAPLSIFPLPALPASLTTSNTVRVRAVIGRRASPSSGITWQARPQSTPVIGFPTVIASGELATQAECTGTGMFAKTANVPFGTGLRFAQAAFSCTTSINAPAVMAARFEAANPVGMSFDTYSSSGYTASILTTRHANMGAWFDALGFRYRIAVITLGTNDSATLSPNDYKTNMQAVVNLVRSAVKPDVIVLVGEPPRPTLSTAREADHEQYAGVLAEIANEATQSDVVAINARRAIAMLGVGLEDERLISGTSAGAVYFDSWASATTYAVGAIVFNRPIASPDAAADNRMYRSLASHSNSRPPSANWANMDWTSSVTYAVGDIVWYRGRFWRNTIAGGSIFQQPPDNTGSGWEEVGSFTDGIHWTSLGASRWAACVFTTMSGAAATSVNSPTAQMIVDAINADTTVGGLRDDVNALQTGVVVSNLGDIASEVWTAGTRTLTGEVEVDEQGIADAVAAALAGVNVTVQSPVASDGTISIVQGDAYAGTITLTASGLGVEQAGQTHTLRLLRRAVYERSGTSGEADTEVTTTATNVSGNAVASFTLSSTDTASLDSVYPVDRNPQYVYQWLNATTGRTFAIGNVEVKRAILPEA